METASKSKVEIVFEECGHQRLFQFPYPERGEVLWCPDCREDRKVAEAPSRFNSACSKCSYGKNGMLSRDKVIDNARRHVDGLRHRKTHKVTVRDGSTPIYEVAYMDETELYAGVNRARVARDAQATLRAVTTESVAGQHSTWSKLTDEEQNEISEVHPLDKL